MFKKHKVLQLIVILLVLSQTSVGLVVAIAKNSLDPISNDGVISAAYKDNGDLRLVNGPDDIKKDETFISWNQQGIAGPQGPQGATGATGATGSFNATQWQQVLNNTGNASAHYALTSAHGVSGNVVGTSGYQVITSKNMTNSSLNGSLKIYSLNGSSFKVIQLIGETDSLAGLWVNGAYGRLRVSNLQITSATGLEFQTNGGIYGYQNNGDGVTYGYTNFYAWNGTASVEVARLQGNATSPYLKISTPPKFATNNVTGPSNNVTPVTWIPILLADNTTAFLPAYK